MCIKQFLKSWLPLLLWMSAIFFVSAQPSADIPDAGQWDLLVKKGAHFVAYGILAVLAFRVVNRGKRPFLTAFLISVLYAMSDEYHQTFVAGRNGTMVDVLIDASGAAFALWLLAQNKLNLKWMRPATQASDPP